MDKILHQLGLLEHCYDSSYDKLLDIWDYETGLHDFCPSTNCLFPFFFPQLHIGAYSWPLDRPGLSPCWWTAHEQQATWLNKLIGEEEKNKRTEHILCSCIAFQNIHVFSSPKVVVVSLWSYFGALERSWQLWTGGSCCLWGSESEGATIFPGMMLT